MQEAAIRAAATAQLGLGVSMLPATCMLAVKKLLCASMFPPCLVDQNITTGVLPVFKADLPQMPCQSVCLATLGPACPSLAPTLPILVAFLPPGAGPNCSDT
jgi:hypothetical protein